MLVGVHLPHVGPNATRDNLRQFAQTMENLGFASLWVSDHVIVPREYESRYPYHPSGRLGPGPDTPFLEPIMALQFVAACTEKVQLGTTVLVLPMRNPVLHAKMLGSLDVLSNGRLIFGAGVGWLREEFEALDMPFDHRGARMDEFLAVMKRLWTEEDPSYSGKYYQLSNVGFAPKPVQKPHPPIWIGGNTEPALRRAGRLGDAWHAAGAGVEEVRDSGAKVKQSAAAAGRDPNSVDITARVGLRFQEQHLAGEVDKLMAYRDAGVSHMVLDVNTRDLDAVYEGMAQLAEKLELGKG